MQVSENVVLDHGILCNSCMVSSGMLSTNAVTESEDVLVLIVLQSILVHIDKSIGIAKARVSNQRLWLAGRVDAC